jgi:hypothetical protein
MAFKLRGSSPLMQIDPPGKVKYGTPEYKKAYDKGEVISKSGVRSPIALDEVVVRGKPKEKGFWKQSISKYTKENKDTGLLGAIGSVVTYPMSVPQDAMTYATTGKVQRPSEALKIKNPIGAAATDMVLDPTNLVGGGAVGKKLVSGNYKLLEKISSEIPKNLKSIGSSISKGLKPKTKVIETYSNKSGSNSSLSKVDDIAEQERLYNMGLIEKPSGILEDDYASYKARGFQHTRPNYLEKFIGDNVSIPDAKPATAEKKMARAKKNVEGALNANLDWVESKRYVKNRSKNTGETPEEVIKSVREYKDTLLKTKLRFKNNKNRSIQGSYNTSLVKDVWGDPEVVHRIDVNESKASLVNKKERMHPEATLDHEIGHALSPAGKAGQNELYKNYPVLSTSKSLKSKGGNITSQDLDEVAYLNKPAEQQVRFKRLSQNIRRHAGIDMEAPITKEHVSNYKKATSFEGGVPEMFESGDVTQLLNRLPSKNKSDSFLAKHLNNIWAGPAITIGGLTLSANKNKNK